MNAQSVQPIALLYYFHIICQEMYRNDKIQFNCKRIFDVFMLHMVSLVECWKDIYVVLVSEQMCSRTVTVTNFCN